MAKHQVKPAAVIIDGKRLRRAAFSALLRDWARSAQIELLELVPPGALPASQDNHVRILILNLGGEPLSERGSLDSIAAIQQQWRDVPIVILSDREDRQQVQGALDAGVQGLLPISMAPELALEALTFVLHGGAYFPPTALRRAAAASGEHSKTAAKAPSTPSGDYRRMEQAAPDPEPCPCEPLCPPMTGRQHEVLELLRQGYSNKIIARELCLAEATVKVHVRQIMRKLGASNRTQAAISMKEVPAAASDLLVARRLTPLSGPVHVE